MSSSSLRTPEQVRQDHLAMLGPQLGPVYNALTNEVVSLHGKWNQFRKLFMASKTRVDLLNESAPYFFSVLQETLMEDILLHLARLTDPPDHGGKTNLTLQQLPDLVSDPKLQPDVRNLVDGAVASCAAARDWRNRRLAHRDLGLALAGFGTAPATPKGPLKGVTPADIEASLKAFRDVVHRLERHYWNGSETAYEYFEGGRGDADTLLRYLQRGVKSFRARDQRFREAKPLPEDLEPESDV